MGRGEEIKMDMQGFLRNEWLDYAGAESWSAEKQPLFGRGNLKTARNSNWFWIEQAGAW